MRQFIRQLARLTFYFLSLFFLIFYLLLFLNLVKERENLAKKIEFAVLIKEGLSAEQIADAGEKLRHLKAIKEIFYISKEEAFRQLQENPILKESITLLKENPLPASFTVYPQSFEEKEINELLNSISSLPEAEKIIFNQEFFKHYSRVDTIHKVLNTINFVFLIALSVFLILTIFYLFSLPLDKKIIFLSYRVKLFFSLLGSGLLLLIIYQIKLHFLKTIIFFNLQEIILLFLLIAVLTFFFNTFSFEPK